MIVNQDIRKTVISMTHDPVLSGRPVTHKAIDCLVDGEVRVLGVKISRRIDEADRASVLHMCEGIIEVERKRTGSDRGIMELTQSFAQ